MMKSLRQGNIYIVQGSTVTYSVAVLVSSSDDDLTCLWHMVGSYE